MTGLFAVTTRLLVLPLQIEEGVAVRDDITGKGLTLTVALIVLLEHPPAEAVIV